MVTMRTVRLKYLAATLVAFDLVRAHHVLN